jgi:hypothetical protein
METFKPGIYRHYKGGLYRALCLVEHHESRQEYVVYVCLEKGTVNIRPLNGGLPNDPDGWTDIITSPTVIMQPRFVLIS